MPRSLVLAAAALCALVALPARTDPRYVWETMDTPHFEIHYHQGGRRLAAKVARIAEEAHRRLAPLLQHEPTERCQIVLSDDVDFANGSATPLLFNTVRAFAAPPDARSTLNDFDDWVTELIDHEYTHILHLDTVGGVPAVSNNIFGKIWIPNAGQPLWFIEGIATFAESEITAAGRVRSSQEEMTVRAQVLEGKFPRIDRLSNLPLDWPRAAAWYTLGGRFVTWIGREYGLGALRDISHDFGARAIPLGLNLSAGRVLGDSYLTLYRQFREAESEKALALARAVRAEGETVVEPLTALGERTRSPRWSKDGQTLYYLNAGADRLPELRALEPGPCCAPSATANPTTTANPNTTPTPTATPNPTTNPNPHRRDRHVADTYGDGALALDPRGRIVYSRPQVYQEFEEIEDLYAVDPATGASERLTRGARASAPDVGADGSIVFVQRGPGGRSAIALLTPGARDSRVLFEDPLGEPVGSPRFSPTGDAVAFLHHRDGSWDVRTVRLNGGEPVDVTHDRAIERDPSFTPDGRFLLFSSDRTGVYNVYAYRLADRALLRATNVVLGALEPEVSPDGTQMALVSYSSRGYDLARVPFDPESFVPASAAPAATSVRPEVSKLPPEELYPIRPYSPLKTALPHFWLPFAGNDALGRTLGILTAGFDVVGRHEYFGSAWLGLTSEQPGWDAIYVNHTLYPDLVLETSREVQAVLGRRSIYTERVVRAGAAAIVPFSQIERRHALSLGYELTDIAINTDPARELPRTGLIAAAVAGYAYTDARRFVRSISREEGQRFALTARVAYPALGSDFSFRQLVASYARYLPLPWTRHGRPLHHVLAGRLSAGIARGDFAARHLFVLGGADSGNPFRVTLDPLSPSSVPFRGFRKLALFGEAFVLGSFEYRLPLTNVELGAWTLPLYLRRLHAAAFSDIGDAWMPFDDGPFRKGRPPFELHAGAGLELRAELVLGYVLPVDLRIGCAKGLEKSAISIVDCYSTLGGVF